MDGLVATDDAFWVRDADSVHRIDRDTLEADASVRIPEDFGPFAIAGDAIWITAFDKNELAAYDVATGKVIVRIPVGLHPNVVFEAAGSVWGYNLHGRFIERVDPERRETSFEWDAASLLAPATTPLTDDAIWFGAYDLQRLIAINPTTNGVAANIKVPIQPCGASVFPSFVLGACDSKAVVRVDAEAGTVLATEGLPGVPGGWLLIGGLAWTTLPPANDMPTSRLVGFDPETLEPHEAVDLGSPIRGMVVASDALWVTTEEGILRFELSELGG
jgi:YD repeat-containing protein